MKTCWMISIALLSLTTSLAASAQEVPLAEAEAEAESEAVPEKPPCVCTEQVKPLDAFDAFDLIFFGRASVLAVTELGDSGVEDEFAEFAVDGVWKGPPQRTLRVYTSDGDPHCAYPFEAGQLYLVYAKREKKAFSNRFRTSACTRTVEGEAALPDLAILGLPQERPKRE